MTVRELLEALGELDAEQQVRIQDPATGAMFDIAELTADDDGPYLTQIPF